MALTILTGSSQAAGINYSFRTSGSADWASVPTASYFYDIVDKLPRFKASNSDIQNVITFPFSGSAVITGSLNVTGGITGSLQGTASYATNALSASYAPEINYQRLSDFQSPYHYSGNSILGTLTSSIGWIINRIDFTTPGSPITLQGTGSWNNRTSLIYL